MNAFIPITTTPIASKPRHGNTLCQSRPSPFFASSAFGAPLPARIVTPAARAAVRMDVTIVVGDNEPVESALRRFKKDVTKSGHLFELRRRRYFETNTEKRIRKAAASRRKAKMAKNDSRKNQSQGQTRS